MVQEKVSETPVIAEGMDTVPPLVKKTKLSKLKLKETATSSEHEGSGPLEITAVAVEKDVVTPVEGGHKDSMEMVSSVPSQAVTPRSGLPTWDLPPNLGVLSSYKDNRCFSSRVDWLHWAAPKKDDARLRKLSNEKLDEWLTQDTFQLPLLWMEKFHRHAEEKTSAPNLEVVLARAQKSEAERRMVKKDAEMLAK